MADEGLIDSAPGRAFHKMGGVPKVTVLRIVDVDGKNVIAVPERWEAEGTPPPRLRVIVRGKRSALGLGDRILARTDDKGNGWLAHPLTKLARAAKLLMGGVDHGEGGNSLLRAVDKKVHHETHVVSIDNDQPAQQ